ncbi:nascent polypeptide-associated complex subunit alpha, muscle-specific form-like [Osmerus eperlanus]|uniref:nascent polypeptide-associated complex subunit alpha, muscle-specific form-like n=1 Tax=Osmerus eperlanus TaxID=29151 RepID=UPI002E1471D5
MAQFPGWKGEPYPKPLVRYTRALPIGRISTAGPQPRLNRRRLIPISRAKTVKFSHPDKTQSLIPAITRQRISPRAQAGGRQVRPVTPRPPTRRPGSPVGRRRNASLTEAQLAGRGDGVSLFCAVRDQLLLTSSSESSPSPRSSPSSPPHRCRRIPPAYLTRRYVTQMKLYQALSNEKKKKNRQRTLEGNSIRKGAASCRHVNPPLCGGEGVSSHSLYKVIKRKRSPQSEQQPSQPPSRLARRSRIRPWRRQFDSSASDCPSSDSSPVLNDCGQSPHCLAAPDTPDCPGPCPSTPRDTSVASQSPSRTLSGAITTPLYDTSMIVQSFSSTPSSARTTPLYPHSFTSSAPGTPLHSQILLSSAPGTQLCTPLFSRSAPTTPLPSKAEQESSPRRSVSHSKNRMLRNKAGDPGSCSAKESSPKMRNPESRWRDRSHSGKAFGDPHTSPAAETLKVPEKEEKSRQRKEHSTPTTPWNAGGTKQPADLQLTRLKVPLDPPSPGRSSLSDCELSPPFFFFCREETPRSPRGPAHNAGRKSSCKPPSTSSTSYSPKTSETADRHLKAKTSASVPTTPTSAKYFSLPACLFRRPPTPWSFGSWKTGSPAFHHSPPPQSPKSPDTGVGRRTRKIPSTGYNMTTGSTGTPWVPKTEEDLRNAVGRSPSVSRDAERRRSPPASGLHSHISVRSRYLSPGVKTHADKQELSRTPFNSGPVCPFQRPSSATSSSKQRDSSMTSEGKTRHSYQKPDTPRPKSCPSKTQPSGTPLRFRPSNPGRKSDPDPRARPDTRRFPRASPSSASELLLEKADLSSSAPVRAGSGGPPRKHGERASLPRTRAELDPEEGFRGDNKAKASKGQELFKAPFPCAPSHKLSACQRSPPYAAQRAPLRRDDTHRHFKNTKGTRSPSTQPRLEESGDPLPLQPPSSSPPLVSPCLSPTPSSPDLIHAIVGAISLLLGLSSISYPQLYPATAVQGSPATPPTAELSPLTSDLDPGPRTSTTPAGPARSLSDPGLSCRSSDTPPSHTQQRAGQKISAPPLKKASQ